MSIAFVGYQYPKPDMFTREEYAQWRAAGVPPEEVRERVRAFPEALPPTCKLIGSWQVSGGQAPSILVVEAESYDDLEFVNRYYAGYIDFDWHPTGGIRRDWPANGQ